MVRHRTGEKWWKSVLIPERTLFLYRQACKNVELESVVLHKRAQTYKNDVKRNFTSFVEFSQKKVGEQGPWKIEGR